MVPYCGNRWNSDLCVTFHSTETALLKLQSDLLCAADAGLVSALCILDLTAAFDTVDHELLLHWLERQFGLCVLECFRSYLSGRSFRVITCSLDTSSTVYIVCSVPQGSVLGPHLFILYTADMKDVVDRHYVLSHAFADDTQLYLHCLCSDMAFATTRLELCISDVAEWTSANRLHLNTDKTELLWTGSKNSRQFIGSRSPPLQLGVDTVIAQDEFRLLGVPLSSDLSLDRHISNVCASCYHRMRQLRPARRSLDANSLATLVHAFVISRVDYCNSLLAAVPKYTTDKLQHVLVAAARVITSTRKYDRGLSRLLHEELHWLDVPERILFKLCVFIHQCLNNNVLRYLMDTCSSVATVPDRQCLRSAGRNYPVVPRHWLATYGRRTFVIAGPSAWNDLPDELRDISLSRTVFRSRLKTYFFSYY